MLSFCSDPFLCLLPLNFSEIGKVSPFSTSSDPTLFPLSPSLATSLVGDRIFFRVSLRKIILSPVLEIKSVPFFVLFYSDPFYSGAIRV